MLIAVENSKIMRRTSASSHEILCVIVMVPLQQLCVLSLRVRRLSIAIKKRKLRLRP